MRRKNQVSGGNTAKSRKEKDEEKQKETNLAPLLVLNHPPEYQKNEEEEERQKDKMAVMVGADGMKYTQREKNDKTYKTETKVHNDYSSKKDTTFTQSSSSFSS